MADKIISTTLYLRMSSCDPFSGGGARQPVKKYFDARIENLSALIVLGDADAVDAGLELVELLEGHAEAAHQVGLTQPRRTL